MKEAFTLITDKLHIQMKWNDTLMQCHEAFYG